MFEIEINVAQESDLYNPYDSRMLMPSDDLIGYVTKRLEERPFGEKVHLVFTGDEIDKDRLKRAMDASRKAQKEKLVKERKMAIINSIRLLLIGIVFVVVGISLSEVMSEVVAAVVSTIGSFSIWEAANQWIKELPALRFRSRMCEVLGDYTIQ